MKIEHFAYQVEDAAALAVWYEAHLGFVTKRGTDDPFGVRFLADEAVWSLWIDGKMVPSNVFKEWNNYLEQYGE